MKIIKILINTCDLFKVFRSKFLDPLSNNVVLLADMIVDFFSDTRSNKKRIKLVQVLSFPIKNPNNLFKLCQK